MAKEFVGNIVDRVDEAMTVIETVKKIPEYNADLTVMMAMRTAKLKVLYSDPRCDDWFLNDSDAIEPKTVQTDNFMREGLDVKS